MLKWLNKLHRAEMTFLPAIHGVPGQQLTPGGDRAVAVCHLWAIFSMHQGGERWCCLLSMTGIVWIIYNERKDSWGERMERLVQFYRHWSCREKEQTDLQYKWQCCKCERKTIFQCHFHKLKELSIHIMHKWMHMLVSQKFKMVPRFLCFLLSSPPSGSCALWAFANFFSWRKVSVY